MLSQAERRSIKDVLGKAYLEAQEPLKVAGHSPDMVVPEITGALLLLAYFLASKHMGMNRDAFMTMCGAAAALDYEL